MGIKTICHPDPCQWHRWFAWHPVWFGTEAKGDRICNTRAWWVYIERKYRYHWDSGQWSYRRVQE